MAEIINNEWMVSPGVWDKNFNNDSLEVKDATGDIVLQIRVMPDRVRLQGKWYQRNGQRTILMEHSSARAPSLKAKIKFGRVNPQDDVDPGLKIKPMFKYPSRLHMGELLY